MATKDPGFFSIEGVDQFAVKAGKSVTAFKDAEGRIAYIADDGSGFLSNGLAELLVDHIQKAIVSGGKTIGKSYDSGSMAYSSAYEESLVKGGRTYKFFQNTGWLLASIKVLNRRYSGGRGAVAGIDPNLSVPHLGWRGEDVGGSIKVSTYAKAITFGSPANDYRGDIPARPVIMDAIEYFITGLGPDIAQLFWKNYTGQMQAKFTERMRFGGTLGSTLEAGQGSSENTGSFFDLGSVGNGFSVGGASDNEIESDSVYNADAKRALKKAAKASGLSASEIAKWAKV